MLDLILTGGWLMLPLLICSILALAIIIERAWYLKLVRNIPPSLSESTLKLLQSGQLSKEKLAQIEFSSNLGFVLANGLKQLDYGLDKFEQAMSDAANHVNFKLEKYFAVLETIVNIAPLLGLLGTVVGMIDIFAAINGAGLGDPQALAGGIGKALLTTAIGLSIAIPALIGLKYFERRRDEILTRIEANANYMLNELLSLNMLRAKLFNQELVNKGSSFNSETNNIRYNS